MLIGMGQCALSLQYIADLFLYKMCPQGHDSMAAQLFAGEVRQCEIVDGIAQHRPESATTVPYHQQIHHSHRLRSTHAFWGAV